MVIPDTMTLVMLTELTALIKVEEGLDLLTKITPMMPAGNTRAAIQQGVNKKLVYMKRTSYLSTMPSAKKMALITT